MLTQRGRLARKTSELSRRAAATSEQNEGVRHRAAWHYSSTQVRITLPEFPDRMTSKPFSYSV
jgi:hypothetical protein